jgi:hypothetical protein
VVVGSAAEGEYVWPYGGGGKRASAITSPKGQTRDDESAPLHSPKLTQGRAHPAVVYSTPAGERQRPRVRRCHEEKTRGGASLLLTFVSNYETAFQILDTARLRRGRSQSVMFSSS